LVNGKQVWQTAQRFGKRHTNFSLQISHNVVGVMSNCAQNVYKIEQQNFPQNMCASKFLLGEKMFGIIEQRQLWF